jgi:cytochrome c oxidase subunit 4
MTSHAQDPGAEVRGYLAVFAALLVLTLLTVAVSYVHLSEGPAVAVALAIATGKAALVAMFFMHLKGERAMVHWTLGLTAILFLALIVFLFWTEADHLLGTEFTDAFGGASQ